MKKILLFISLILTLSLSYSQGVAINDDGSNPDASAILDVKSTDMGILIPRVSIPNLSNAAPITSPTTSLMVYNTNTTTGVGYHYWNGIVWIKLFTSADVRPPKWNGNNNTTDDINRTGSVGIGTASITSKLHVINTTASSDAGAVQGIQNNTDYWGKGGIFSGGYMGIQTDVYPTGSSYYYGISSTVSGGSGINYGLDSYVYGTGTNYGIYSYVDGGTTNYGIYSSAPDYGVYGVSSASDGFGIFGTNTNTTGTGVVGVGNNVATISYLSSGSGIAGSGVSGVYGFSTSTNGTGVIGAGNNGSVMTLTNGSGVAGTGTQVGVYGYTNSGTGAGLLGQNGNSSGWAADFQGRTKIGTATTEVHDFWGTLKCATTSDSHIIRPNADYYSFVGTSTYAWWYMYSYNFIDPSRRELKRDIKSIDGELAELVMQDIIKIKPSFYKYNVETDDFQKGNEYKFRPNYHLGVILDESPDYIQDNAFSGIDIYALATMSLVGVKYNNNEIKKLKTKITDFGCSKLNGREIYIKYSYEFSSQLQEIPIIVVTSNDPNIIISVIDKTLVGFKIITSQNVSNLSFDWIAMSKIEIIDNDYENEKHANNLIVSDEDKMKLINFIKSEDAKLNQLNPDINTNYEIKIMEVEKNNIKHIKSNEKK